MRYKRRLYLYSVAFILIVLVLVYLRIKADINAASEKPRAVPPVEVAYPVRGTIYKSLSFNGDVNPIQQASIYSRVSGNINDIMVNIGDYVHRDQLLAVIDSTIYSQNVRQALAAYMQARASFENAKLIYERNKSLLEQNLIAKQDFDNSETAYKVAKAQEEAAKANYNNAETQLSYCRITAPFSGYITRRFLDPGSFVSASLGSPGSTIFTLMDMSTVKVFVNVLEKDIPAIQNVNEVEVTVDAYPGRIFRAHIRRISQQLDLSTRTMPVEVDIKNPDNVLKPGMFSNVNLILDKHDGALIVPSQYVMHDEKGYYVYTLSADTVVHKAYVKLGLTEDNRDEILGGITDNTLVVSSGQDIVRDGMKVRLTK
ncbi:MAG: efflux RND transporter periplasmic adaptor subunit [Candidatus Kryptoniota bacterium]